MTFEALSPLRVRIDGQERAVRVGDILTLSERQSLNLLAKAQAKVRQVDGGPCYACRSTRRWLSVYGAVICGECHPPASLELVERWIEIEKESYR